MAEDRAPRNTQVREKTSRKSDEWIPQSQLPQPDPRPGWAHRWVRTHMLGVADYTNVSKKFREGWEMCSLEEYLELKAWESDIDSRFEGGVHIGGSLLCRMPSEKVEARTKYHQNINDTQMEGVDRSFLRESDPRMPMLPPERRTRTQFGKG